MRKLWVFLFAVTSVLASSLIAIESASGNVTYTATGRVCTIVGNNFGQTLNGTSGDDVICGLGGNDIINGNGGNDVLDGGQGNDTLNGGIGNDTMIGATGADTFNGGPDSDTVSYAYITSTNTPVVADIDGNGDDGPSGERDNIRTDIENIIGSSSNDTLTGNISANTLNGGPGNDTLNGGIGNDTMIGATGSDTFNGGLDSDTVSYSYITSTNSPVVADIDGNGDDGTSGEGDNIRTDIENIIGSSSNDILSGSSSANTLNGGGGNDTLNGGAGNDTLNGGNGNELIFGNGQDDVLNAGQGTEEIVDGGAGNDICSSDDSEIEIPISCASVSGFGAYSKVALIAPWDNSTSLTWSGWSLYRAPSATFSDGSMIFTYVGPSGNVGMVKLTSTGAIDVNFGPSRDGWLRTTDILVGGPNTAVFSQLIVYEDSIYVLIQGDDAYIAKFDSSGNLVTDFGSSGVSRLAPALGIASTRLSGFYRLQPHGNNIAVVFNDMEASTLQFSNGYAEINKSTGAPANRVLMPDPIIAGDIVHPNFGQSRDLPSNGIVTSDGTFIAIYPNGRTVIFDPLTSTKTWLSFDPIPSGIATTPVIVGSGGVESTLWNDGIIRALLVGEHDPANDATGWRRIFDSSPAAVILDGFADASDPVGTALSRIVVPIPAGDDSRCDTNRTGMMSHESLKVHGNRATFGVARCGVMYWAEVDLTTGVANVVTRRSSATVQYPNTYMNTLVSGSDQYMVYLKGTVVIEKVQSALN